MVPVGLALVFGGYSLIYMGVWRMRGDQRTLADIWLGRSTAYTPVYFGATPPGGHAPGAGGNLSPGNPGTTSPGKMGPN